MSRKTPSYALMILLITSIFLQGCGQKNENVTPDISQEEIPTTLTDQAKAVLMEGEWKLNTGESTMAWSAQKIVGGHNGMVSLKEGVLMVDGQGLASGQFVVDMTTISDADNSESLVKHLSGDDFFAVETHPEAKFVITRVEEAERSQDAITYDVTGDLTIRDLTHSIVFKATATPVEKMTRVKADFTIDRTRWGIVFNSSSFFQDLGDKAIKDLINFQLDLVFDLQ